MGNAYKTAFLWAKATPHTITLSNKDMDFKELRMYSRDVILGAHHIPLSVMGISENVNRANAEAGEYTFSKRVIKPELTQIREALNEQLCPIFGDDLNFDFDDPVPANREQMVTETVSLLSVGAITREMACQNLGYNIPEDGTYLLPFSVMPTPVKEIKPNTNISEGQPVATNSGDTAENIAAGAKLNGIQIQAAVTVIRDYIDGLIPAAVALELLIAVGIDRERAQSMIDACTNFTPTATQEEVPSNPKVKSYSESQKENMWRSYVGQAEKDEAIFKSTMKRLFESQVSEAKENVGKDSLLNLKQANEDFKKALLPAVEQSFKTGWKFADSTTRRPIKGIEPVLNPLALEWIKNHALELAKGLNETTIDELKVILADGYEMGESIPQLVNRIEEYYMNASRARAEMVARTETIAASNEGAVQLYESEGIEKVEFYPALDERTCDECMSLYKQSPTWTVKESHGMLPVHPHCSCIFLAVGD